MPEIDWGPEQTSGKEGIKSTNPSAEAIREGHVQWAVGYVAKIMDLVSGFREGLQEAMLIQLRFEGK